MISPPLNVMTVLRVKSLWRTSDGGDLNSSSIQIVCLPSGLCCRWLWWAEPPEQCGVLRLLLQPLDRGGPHERGRQLSGRGQLCRQALCHRRRARRRHLFGQGGKQMCASPNRTLKHIMMTAEGLFVSDNLFSVIIPLMIQGKYKSKFFSK